MSQMSQMRLSLDQLTGTNRRAADILLGNDRGGYTVPSAKLYPFQWNWDSALVALGFSVFDPDRAWQEIESLLSAQWDNGMVPHIIFWKEEKSYFPGPEQWGTTDIANTPPTSGITQPPVAATVIERLLAEDIAAHRDRAAKLLPKLDRWHQWFLDARDPDGRGVVAIMHPWESGRDNLPDWDRPLSFIDTTGVGTYHRRDTDIVNQDERPKNNDYDHYMALVRFGRDSNWDTEIIARDCPFWVAEPGMNAILRRAERDLINMATLLGQDDIAARAKARLARLDAGFEQLWSEPVGGYVTLDLRRGEHATGLTSGSWLALFAGAVEPARAGKMAATLTHWVSQVEHSVPSFDPGHELFDSIRYWRGPVWAMINWMIATGLSEHGETDLADRIRRDTQSLIELSEFREYFCPVTGRGGGGTDFSWTASMSLYWAARPEALPTASRLSPSTAPSASPTGTADQENT